MKNYKFKKFIAIQSQDGQIIGNGVYDNLSQALIFSFSSGFRLSQKINDILKSLGITENNLLRVIEVKVKGDFTGSFMEYASKNYTLIGKISLDELIDKFTEAEPSNESLFLLTLILCHEDLTLDHLKKIFDFIEKRGATQMEYQSILSSFKITPEMLDKILEKIKFNNYNKFMVEYFLKSKGLTRYSLETLVDKLISNYQSFDERSCTSSDDTFKSYILAVIEDNILDNPLIRKNVLNKIIFSMPCNEILEKITSSPKADLEILKKVLHEVLKKKDCFLESDVILNIINREETTEEMLTKIVDQMVIKVIDRASGMLDLDHDSVGEILTALMNNPKSTKRMFNDVVELYFDDFPAKKDWEEFALKIDEEEELEFIKLIVNDSKLSEIQFERILSNTKEYEKLRILVNSPLFKERYIIDLYNKLTARPDLELFEKLLNIEKLNLVKLILENNNCDNKLDFKIEYLKILNKYLKFGSLKIRLKTLEILSKEGYLSEEDIEIINPDYIKESIRI